uniref:C-type lectin domain-containing protein n=1 Tax=Panagrolaimus sp. PS1159 TaxID=55785 RepID=A0AC35GS85_9BILA
MANLHLSLLILVFTFVSYIYADTFVKTGIWLNNVENEDRQLVCTVTCEDSPIPTPPPHHHHPGGDCNDTTPTQSTTKKPCGCHHDTTATTIQQQNATTTALPTTTTTVNSTQPGTKTNAPTTSTSATTTITATSSKTTVLPLTTTPCTEIDGIENYVLKSKSRRWRETTVSIIESINFEMYGLNIYMDFDGALYVNQIQQQYPYYFPDQVNPKLSITRNGQQKIITTVDGITVTFENMLLCINIPDCLPFYGKDKLCGIAGNYDGQCTDDLIYKNRTLFSNQRLPCIYGDTVSNWGNDWIDTDYYTPTEAKPCEAGVDNQTPTDCAAGKTSCALIQQAQTGTGVFEKCKDLGVDVFTAYYSNCVSDVCASADLKCSALESFVKLCQQKLKVDLTGWRNTVNCPYSCPANSSYNSHAPSTQPTCATVNMTPSTITTTSEGCICDNGYVIDPLKVNFTCILQEDCQCIDENGISHTSLNDPWISKNCTLFNHCWKGKQISRPTTCSFDEKCVTTEGRIEICQSDKCPNGWNYFNTTNSCYKAIYDVNYVTGEAECVKQGGALVSIHSPAENNFVLDLIYISTTPLGFYDYTFIGWNGDLENRWVDGSPNDFYPATKAPDSQRRCIAMRTEPVEGLWVFVDCNVNQRSGVCKKTAN